MKMYHRTGTVTVTRTYREEVEVEGTFTVTQVVADWEANRGEERWTVSGSDGFCIDHFATEAEAVEAIESGRLDKYLEDE